MEQKKAYVSPLMEVVQIATQSMLAASPNIDFKDWEDQEED